MHSIIILLFFLPFLAFSQGRDFSDYIAEDERDLKNFKTLKNNLEQVFYDQPGIKTLVDSLSSLIEAEKLAASSVMFWNEKVMKVKKGGSFLVKNHRINKRKKFLAERAKYHQEFLKLGERIDEMKKRLKPAATEFYSRRVSHKQEE